MYRAARAEALAESLRYRLGVRDDELTGRTLRALCAAGGFAVRPAAIRSRHGAATALLVPEDVGGFTILVDEGMRSGGTGDLFRNRYARFLIAHEIGHSVFYDRSAQPPRRLVLATRDEEEFCNVFAARLLAPLPASSIWSFVQCGASEEAIAVPT
jgi:hypothetical protein